MSSSIAVRNLTSSSVFIKRIEQFEDPGIQQSRPSGFFFATKNDTLPAPVTYRLGNNNDSLQCLEVNIVLAPFESCSLEQAKHAKDSHDEILGTSTALRITIEDAQGSQHHIDAHPSYTQKYSSTSTSLSSPSLCSYTALFHPTRPTPHLTIHDNHLLNYRTWMSTIPDALPLSALSIPGTHNSHTHYRALPSVRCQSVDIGTQLASGIRFLDIRLQPISASKKDLYLVHGAFPISLTGPKYFASVLQTCYDFLAAQPSETIIVSLKREGIGGATDEDLARILAEEYFAPDAEKWHLGTRIPTLGEARGKLVLLRRYRVPQGEEGAVGLDATAWPNSPAHALFSSPGTEEDGATFCLQDFCDVMHPSSIATKLQFANEHLVRAAGCRYIDGQVDPLYLNYLSASNFWNKACWPEKIAAVVNRGMEEWVCGGHGLESAPSREREPGHVDEEAQSGRVRSKAQGDCGTGVVVMDFVGDGGDWDLVKLVVGMNMNLRG